MYFGVAFTWSEVHDLSVKVSNYIENHARRILPVDVARLLIDYVFDQKQHDPSDRIEYLAQSFSPHLSLHYVGYPDWRKVCDSLIILYVPFFPETQMTAQRLDEFLSSDQVHHASRILYEICPGEELYLLSEPSIF
jgi:hypothetical protein